MLINEAAAIGATNTIIIIVLSGAAMYAIWLAGPADRTEQVLSYECCSEMLQVFWLDRLIGVPCICRYFRDCVYIVQ